MVQATHWLLAEFLLGVFLGLAFKQGRQISNAAGGAAIAVCLILLPLALVFKENEALIPILRFLVFGFAGASLVAAFTLTPFSKSLAPPRGIMLIGDASYSLYLTHVFTIPAGRLMLERLPVSLPLWSEIGLLFAASIFVSLVFYFGFEKPSQKYLRARFSAFLRKEKA